MSAIRPVIYCESTLANEQVKQMLPTAVVRPSISRGDLYRDRALGYAVFLIIDGVFLQRQAVSPREVMDVSRDGALVIGASSMGALRAAECWPGGMRGVGSIYRLFRRGWLDSDDEVIVMFSPLDGSPLTQALVNVRYAVNRACCKRLLRPDEGRRIVASARSLFFADRSWSNILEQSGMDERRKELTKALAEFDLKQKDARVAVARLGRWLESPEALPIKSGAGVKALLPSEMQRESSLSLPTSPEEYFDALSWVLRTSDNGIINAHGPDGDASAMHRVVCESDSSLAGKLVGQLGNSDQLAACWFRHKAAMAALDSVGECPGKADAASLEVAGQQLAAAHGFDSWPLLLKATEKPCCVQELRRCRQQLAAIARVKVAWFQAA